jgi:hypothetical protein
MKMAVYRWIESDSFPLDGERACPELVEGADRGAQEQNQITPSFILHRQGEGMGALCRWAFS